MKAVLDSYKRAWKCLKLNWRLVFLLYFALLGMTYLALFPFGHLINEVFGDRLMLQDFIGGFDYTSIAELLNQHGVGTIVSLNAAIVFFVVYFLWSAFYTGGVLEIAHQRNVRSSRLLFWKGAAQYFFRMFRLSLYILLIYGMLLALCYFFFTKDGINPLHLDSENFLIVRFKILLLLIILVGFLVSVFRDLAKAFIVHKPETYIITFANLNALKTTFSIKSVCLALLNFFVLGFAFMIYYLLKNLTGDAVWPAVIASQIFILFRIAYKVVRIISFSYLVEEQREAIL